MMKEDADKDFRFIIFYLYLSWAVTVNTDCEALACADLLETLFLLEGPATN